MMKKDRSRRSDAEKLQDLWVIMQQFADHMTNGDDTTEAVEHLYEAGATDGLMLALGYSKKDLNGYSGVE